MLAISFAEFFATGSASTRWFHGLSAGNRGQFDAPGSGLACTSAGTANSAQQTTTNSRRRGTARDDRCWSRKRPHSSFSRPAGAVLRDDAQARPGHAELGLGRLADVVAVDLQRQG